MKNLFGLLHNPLMAPSMRVPAIVLGIQGSYIPGTDRKFKHQDTGLFSKQVCHQWGHFTGPDEDPRGIPGRLRKQNMLVKQGWISVKQA